MKVTSFALLLAAGCAQSITNFAGTYSGSLTETFTCETASPPPFQTAETFTVSQLGPAVIVAIGSCTGQSVGGDSSGNRVTLTPSSQTISPCQQIGTDAGVVINVTGFSGGTLTLESGGNLQVSLMQNATTNGGSNACTGAAAGSLMLQ